MNDMRVLGIESTAHTLGIGVVEDGGKVLSSARQTYIPEEGGILPSESADFLASKFEEVLQESLDASGCSFNDIDGIAFSQGPGLGPCLRVGAAAARYLALKHKKPLIGVNHCIAHIEIAKVTTGAKDPVILYVSGGNSQVIAYAEGRYRVFGETLDIAVGNCLDAFSRVLGLQHPGGPKIEKLASKGKNYIELPYVVKGMDLSFSGLYSDLKRKKLSGQYSDEDLCYSFQETAFAMLTEATERAMAHLDKEEVLATGGVAANSRLQNMLEIMAEERGAKYYGCPREHCGDNGAMIAWAGLLMLKSNNTLDIKNSKINPKFRTDDVDVTWL